jgi:hypothetical protein
MLTGAAARGRTIVFLGPDWRPDAESRGSYWGEGIDYVKAVKDGMGADVFFVGSHADLMLQILPLIKQSDHGITRVVIAACHGLYYQKKPMLQWSESNIISEYSSCAYVVGIFASAGIKRIHLDVCDVGNDLEQMTEISMITLSGYNCGIWVERCTAEPHIRDSVSKSAVLKYLRAGCRTRGNLMASKGKLVIFRTK